MDEIISSFEKNKREEVRVILNEFNGKPMFHIRAYYQDNGEWKPGKGIGLSVDRYKELAGAILDLGERLAKDGLIK